jgi:hypothetical protein
VTHAYPEWSDLQPDFKYHGRNVYAYLLAKYGETVLPVTNSAVTDGDGVKSNSKSNDRNHEESSQSQSQNSGGEEEGDTTVDTFDFITVQLYEGYSHVQYKTQVLHMSPALVLCDLARRLYNGWNVDFSTDREIEPLSFPSSSSSFQSALTQRVRVRVKKTQLVIGLANGWAGDGKFLLLYRDAVRTYGRIR